jgi:hypothetical protein
MEGQTMITRAPRPTSNFYLLDKAISEDKRLSWAARGVLIFLLGKPDHWTVSPTSLVNETAKSSRRVGRDGVYAILKELKEVGYLHTIGNRNDGGTFAGADYLVTESPYTAFPDTVDSPHTAYPDTAEPDTAEPYTANPTVVSIEKKQGLRKTKQGLNAQAAPAPNFVLPDWIPADTWSAFMEVRSGKKAKNTDYALKLLVGTLTKMRAAGHDPVDVINNSIRTGWSDVYAPKASAITPSRRTPALEDFANRTYTGGKL